MAVRIKLINFLSKTLHCSTHKMLRKRD